MDLNGKVIAIIGDEFVADKLHFRYLSRHKKPKSVDYIIQRYADFASVSELMVNYLNTHADVDILLIFPFLWETMYMEWDEELEVNSIHLKDQVNLSHLLPEIKKITNQWHFKFPKLAIFWLLPYTPNFFQFNKLSLSTDYWQEQYVARAFYNQIKDLAKEWHNSIPEIHFLDLHECYFINDYACERTFCSEYKDIIQFPSTCTVDGLCPSDIFVSNFLTVFQERIYPTWKQISEPDTYIRQPQDFSNPSIGPGTFKSVKTIDYHHSSSTSAHNSLRTASAQSHQPPDSRFDHVEQNFNDYSNLNINYQQPGKSQLLHNQNITQGYMNQESPSISDLSALQSQPFEREQYKGSDIQDNTATHNQSSKHLTSISSFDNVFKQSVIPDNSLTSNLPDLPPNMLSTIKDALNFLNVNKPQKKRKISYYEGYLKNFFCPLDWRNLFLTGDEFVALNCLQVCVNSLSKLNNKKGLKIIMITSSENFIREAENNLKSLVDSSVIGFNDFITFGKPLVLVDTPTNIRLRLLQAQFQNLSDVSALLVFGDELLASGTAAGLGFAYLIKKIIGSRAKDDINKVIISESGTAEQENLAHNMFDTTFLVPAREAEKKKELDSKPSLTDFLSGAFQESNLDSFSSSSSKMTPPGQHGSLPDSHSTEYLPKERDIYNMPSGSVQDVCHSRESFSRGRDVIHPQNSLSKESTKSFLPERKPSMNSHSKEREPSSAKSFSKERETFSTKHFSKERDVSSRTSYSKERDTLYRNSHSRDKSRSPLVKRKDKALPSPLSLKKSEAPETTKSTVKLEDIFKLGRIDIPEKKLQEYEEHDKKFMSFLLGMPYSIQDTYLVEGKKAVEDHDSDYRTYKEVPDLHPQYEEKYGIFIKVFEEAYGKNCNPKHVQSTWKRFWDITITSLKDSEWLENKKNLQKAFMEKCGSNADIITTGNTSTTTTTTTTTSLKSKEEKKLKLDKQTIKEVSKKELSIKQEDRLALKEDKKVLTSVGKRDGKISEVKKDMMDVDKKINVLKIEKDDDSIRVINSGSKDKMRKRENISSNPVSPKRSKLSSETSIPVSNGNQKLNDSVKDAETKKSNQKSSSTFDIKSVVEMRRKLVMESDSPNDTYDPFSDSLPDVKRSLETKDKVKPLSEKKVTPLLTSKNKSPSSTKQSTGLTEESRSLAMEISKLISEKKNFSIEDENKSQPKEKRNSAPIMDDKAVTSAESIFSKEGKSLSEEVNALLFSFGNSLNKDASWPSEEDNRKLIAGKRPSHSLTHNRMPSTEKNNASSKIHEKNIPPKDRFSREDTYTKEYKDNFLVRNREDKYSTADKNKLLNEDKYSRENKNLLVMKDKYRYEDADNRLSGKGDKYNSKEDKSKSSFKEDRYLKEDYSLSREKKLSPPIKKDKRSSTRNDDKYKKDVKSKSLKEDKHPVNIDRNRTKESMRVDHRETTYQSIAGHKDTKYAGVDYPKGNLYSGSESKTISRSESKISSFSAAKNEKISTTSNLLSSFIDKENTTTHEGVLPYDKYLEILQGANRSSSTVKSDYAPKSKTLFPIQMDSISSFSMKKRDNNPDQDDFMKIYIESCSATSNLPKKDSDLPNVIDDFAATGDYNAHTKQELNLPTKQPSRQKIIFNLNKPKIQFSLYEALMSIEAICPKIGVMGPALKQIITNARARLPNIYEAYKLFTDSDSELLVSISINKLKSLLASCSPSDKELYQKTIMLGQKLLEEAKKSVKNGSSHTHKPTASPALASPPLPIIPQVKSKSGKAGLDVEAIARATVGLTTEDTFQFIKNTFMYKGLSDPTRAEIDQVFQQVSKLHFHYALKL